VRVHASSLEPTGPGPEDQDPKISDLGVLPA
jgi:hypothetical protein